ncbi:MAG: kelch repeat-containing protein [Verrucomicrobiota bacterium]
MKTQPRTITSFIRTLVMVSLFSILLVIQPVKATSVPSAMTTARVNHTATLLPNGKTLIVGGNTTGANAEIYDPESGIWTATGSMVASRSGAAVMMRNGKVLVVGGSAAGDGAALYDPAADTWASTRPMNYACGNSLTATLLTNGQVLIVGGTSTNWWRGPNVLHSTSEIYDPLSDMWTPTAWIMRTKHTSFTSTLLPNGKVLVAGGAGRISELYDPVSGTWTTTGSLNNNRSGHAAILFPNGQVLVAGGSGSASELASCEIYDPATGTWSPVWSPVASMQNPRSGHSMTLLPNGQVLVTGGWSRRGNAATVTYSSAEVYDPPSGVWTTISPLTTMRGGQTATLLPDGKLLLAGGGVICPDAGSYCSTLSSAELYDAPDGYWTTVGPMIASHSFHTANLLTDGHVLVAGGNSSASNTELYDSSSGTWTATGPLNTPSEFHSGTVLPNGKVLVAGGETWRVNPVYISRTELYDPIVNSWALVSPMNDTRGLHTATLLTNGKVLVTGGAWDVVPYAVYTRSSAELYDPAASAWSKTGSMASARCGHTATLLPNGLVLVAGGVYYTPSTGNNLSSAELYNPSTETWIPTAAMTAARGFHTATLLPNGLVLVAGGDSGSAKLSSSELYDPTVGTWAVTGSMSSSRSSHTATLLPNGKVFVAGGFGVGTELYDPIIGTWATATPMVYARTAHTATLLRNGEVLVTGGDSIGTHAEIFDPPTGTPNGSLALKLNPAEAVTNGAQWQVDGRIFQTNEAVVNHLSAGNHTVTFKNIVGWLAPASQTVSVSQNITNAFLGTYTLAYSISVSASPSIGGMTSGGGTFAAGNSQAVTASANAGYAFTNWTENGTVASTTPEYIFVLNTNRTLTANFIDIRIPTNTIVLPLPGQRWPNSVITVMGTARDNVQLSNVWYQINGSGWNQATTTDNWSNWSATVNLIAGTNTIQTYAMDTTGNISATNSVSFIGVLSTALAVSTNGLGSLKPNFNNTLMQVGKSYSMTATAGAGFAFANWMGGISSPLTVLTNGATLQFVMQSNLVLKANFVDIQKPTNNITSPTSGQRWSNGVFTVTGKAGDNVTVSNVLYSLNDTAWTKATTTDNWSNWSATVNLIAGTNTIQTYAMDTTGNISATNSVSFIGVLSTALAVSTNGLGSLKPNFNNTLMQVGKSYSMTATAGAGFAFANWMGGISSPLTVLTNGATLQFVMQSNLVLKANFVDTSKPILSITNLVTGQRVSNMVLTAKGAAKDHIAVANALWQLNGGAWSNAVSVNNWTNWSAVMTLTTRSNTVKAYALDAAGNYSATNSVSFLYIASDTLTVQTNGIGTIKGSYNGKLLELGQSYMMTATPGMGYQLSNWINGGGIVMTSGPILKFTMRSNLTLTANFITNAFLSRKGDYVGIFSPSNDLSNADWTNSGTLKLTVTDKGTFTGQLTYQGKAYPAGGTFDVGGVFSNSIARGKDPALQIMMNLDLSGGNGISGRIKQGTTWAADLWADKVLKVAQKANYLMTAVTQLGNTNGTFQLSVLPSGTVILTGTLSDKTKLTGSLPLTVQNEVVMYQSLYSGKGMWLGYVSFVRTNGVAHWQKLSNSLDKVSPQGFSVNLRLVP